MPISCPLMGFIREQVQLLRLIELPVTAGTHSRQATIVVHFFLVDRPLVYNAIIGRTALNKFRAVSSTPHLKIKFPMDHGVGELKGDQQVAWQCYNVSLRESQKALMQKNSSKGDK